MNRPLQHRSIGAFAACLVLLAAALPVALANESVATNATAATSAAEALVKLQDGNKRYVESHMSGVTYCNKADREKLVAGQHPYAIILSCSDSRVPPELVFDEGLGEIFVVRVAGNIVDPVVLGSIEYAAEHLGTPLIMIMGHEKCGAVKATLDSKGHAEGNIGAIVSGIAPALKTAKAQDAESVADANIALVKANLTAQSSLLAGLVKEGRVKIVTAKYHIDTGVVALIDGLK